MRTVILAAVAVTALAASQGFAQTPPSQAGSTAVGSSNGPNNNQNLSGRQAGETENGNGRLAGGGGVNNDAPGNGSSAVAPPKVPTGSGSSSTGGTFDGERRTAPNGNGSGQ